MLAREVVERDADPLARDEDERVPDAREEEEEDPLEREPVAREVVERLVVREPVRAAPEFERDLLGVERVAVARACVKASRSLSKSLSAALLVLAASRRSARSAVVTSL